MTQAPVYDDRELDRTPPQDLAAEQSVLGAMMMSKDAISDVVEVLRGVDFYRPNHETIFDAIQDPVIRGWVNAWWDEAVTVIDLPAQELADYRAALLDRYLNPKIKHLLKQIAMDGSQKVPIRTVPTLKAVAARGEEPVGAARTVAAWVLNLRGEGAPVSDPFKDELLALVTGDLADSVTKVLEYVGVADEKIAALVTGSAQQILDLKAAK